MRRIQRTQREAPEWLLRGLARVGEWLWQFSQWGERQLAKVSLSRLKWLFFYFLLFCTGVNTFALISVVIDPPKGSTVQSVTVPLRANGPRKRDSVTAMKGVMVNSAFRRYWDSVNADVSMKRSLDSLAVVRPGFADTMRRIKTMVATE